MLCQFPWGASLPVGFAVHGVVAAVLLYEQRDGDPWSVFTTTGIGSFWQSCIM